jgi:hypothetical protein
MFLLTNSSRPWTLTSVGTTRKESRYPWVHLVPSSTGQALRSSLNQSKFYAAPPVAHYWMQFNKLRSAAMVTPPAPASLRRSIKSRSTKELRLVSWTLPIWRFNISRVAAFVLSLDFFTVSVYFSIRSVTVAPLGMGENPEVAMWFAFDSMPADQSLASRLVSKVVDP